MSIIVGLGNPGREYSHTLHNAGFWFIDGLAHKNNAFYTNEKKFQAEVARTQIAASEVWLVKPQTFMNLSGQSLQAFLNFYKYPLERVLVVHDDLDLPVGTVRFKVGGGHGGHNGLRDIIEKCGSNNFQRIRLGIGHPGDKTKVTGHVLGKAALSDKQQIEQAIESAMFTLPLIIDGETQKAMQALHSKDSTEV